jgi:hypothetical protein
MTPGRKDRRCDSRVTRHALRFRVLAGPPNGAPLTEDDAVFQKSQFVILSHGL